MDNKQKAVKRANKLKDWEVTEDDIKYRIDTSYWVIMERGTIAYNKHAPIHEGYDNEVFTMEVNDKGQAERLMEYTGVTGERHTRYIFNVEQGTRECFTGVTKLN